MILRVSLIAILIGIAYLSLTPTETITIGNDKISHFIAYGVLMLNIGLITYPHTKKFRNGIAMASLYGVFMEIGQHYVPGRFMSVYDVVANLLGVFIGAGLIVLFSKTIKKFLKKARII